jgi:hypothetical protein
MNTNKTKQLRRSITASVAAFTFATCVLSTTYATAAPTAETLTVQESPEEPEIGFLVVGLVVGGAFLLGIGLGYYNAGKKSPDTPSIQIPIQTPIKGIQFLKAEGKTASSLSTKSQLSGMSPEFLLDS